MEGRTLLCHFERTRVSESSHRCTGSRIGGRVLQESADEQSARLSRVSPWGPA